MNNKETLKRNLALVAGFNPQALWDHFALLCVTPRPSGGEKEIVDLIFNLATEHDLTVTCDAANNLLVRVPASHGLAHLPSLCLQSHTDMVCQKNADVETIFPIKMMVTEDGNITANGTTLGADNGIGVAAMMALISDHTIPHGPLELLFTATEETGLIGAGKFNYSLLKSKRIFNLDSEEGWILYVGCAGGCRMNTLLEVAGLDCNPEDRKYQIEVLGLAGGHSGMEIHLKRGNAIKILTQALFGLEEHGIQFNLVNFSGGEAMNAIPRNAKATIMVSPDNFQKLLDAFEAVSGDLILGYNNGDSDDRLAIVLREVERVGDEKVFGDENQNGFLQLLSTIPHGVIGWEPADDPMVQTSNNLGMVVMDGNKIEITNMFRSSLEVEMAVMQKIIELASLDAGGTTEVVSYYAPWEPQFDTQLLKFAKGRYEELFGNVPEVKTIHAGLEAACIYKGMKKAKKDVEIISFGPTMGDVHTPKEWVDITSVEKFWDFLLSCLLID